MPRISPIDPAKAQGQAKTLLDAVKAKFGGVPNFLKTLAQAPAALAAFLNFSAAVSEGNLPAALRERIALATAENNGCDYCAAAHQALGAAAGLDEKEIALSFQADASDPKSKAALHFAQKVLVTRGSVSEADIADVKAAGFSDGDVLEIVANVVLNIFSNYANNVAEPDIDFPRARTKHQAA